MPRFSSLVNLLPQHKLSYRDPSKATSQPPTPKGSTPFDKRVYPLTSKGSTLSPKRVYPLRSDRSSARQSPLVGLSTSPGGTFTPCGGLKALWAPFPSRFPCQRKLFLLLPWSLTCRKRGNSAQNEIGPKSGFPVLTRRQSAFRPILSGVS